MTRRAWIGGLAFGSLCLLFWQTSRRLSALTDDAFISFQYARHLVEGHGLVFNVGERVEGYTNLLWVLLMAAGHAVGLDMPFFSQVVSVLCAGALVVSMARFSMEYFSEEPLPWLAFLGPSLVALHPLFSHTMGFGLETVFFSLLTWLSVVSYLRAEQGSGSPYATGLLLGLSYLTRPEAVLWLACFVATDLARILQRPEERGFRGAAAIRYCGSFAAIAGMHLAWRLAYYGDLLPNTYYVKVVDNWGWGWISVRDFVLSTGLLPLVGLVGVPLVLRRAWAMCLWLIIALYLGFVLRTGGSRYLFPLLPLVALLVQEVLRRILATSGRRTGVVACGLLLLLFAAGCVREARLSLQAASHSRLAEWRNTLLAGCLVRATRPGDVIAVIPAGRIPYYTRRPIIDMLGLNDRHIARHGRVDRDSILAHQRADADYVLDRAPRIILVPPDGYGGLPILAITEMLANPRLRDGYEAISLPCGPFEERFFVRRDQPLARP